MSKLLFSAACLLGLPLLSCGQAVPPKARAYVGLGLYTSEYQPISFTANSFGHRLLPLQLTLGYQLMPRLAVQVSTAYSGYESGYSKSLNNQWPRPGILPGLGTEFVRTGARHNLSVAVLGRYALTRQAVQRLQVDALAGATLAKQYFTKPDYSYFPNGTGAYYITGHTHSQVTGVLLTAGAALRYRLVPGLDATFESTANVDLRGNFSGLSSSLALGLRYSFGKT